MPTLVLSGANKGLGLEFARQYLSDGWTVIAGCRRPADAQSLNALGDGPGTLEVHALDVADPTSIEAFASHVGDRPIDLLINNAGLYQKGAVQAFGSYEQGPWIEEFKVNSIGPALMVQRLIDNVRAGSDKTIVTISSQMGSIGDASVNSAYYRSSKTAVNMIMHILARELADEAIKVIPVHPGWVQTDMGGPNALIDAKTSVTGMRALIADLTLDQSGRFWTWDGKELPW